MFLKAITTFILFTSLSYSLMATHGVGAYLNARTFANGDAIELELHLFQLNDGSLNQYASTMFVSGTGSFQLSIVDTIIHPLGDSLCASGSLREYIYRGSRVVNTFLNANNAVFEVIVSCCLVGGVRNLDGTSNEIIRTGISIPTIQYGNPSNNNFRMVQVNTLNMKVNLEQAANTDQFTVLDYSVHSKPLGIDSIRYQLSPIGSQNGGSVYKPGYTYLNPLPDPTEDLLNAQNIFDSEKGTLSFRARGQSSDTGFYLINMDFDMYTDSAKMVKMTALGMLYLQRGDSTLNSTVDFTAQEGAIVQALQNGDTLSRILTYGDSLYLDFQSFSNSGLKLIDGGLMGMPDTTGAHQLYQVQFQQPTFNYSGSGMTQDTIHSSLFWKPGFNDFMYRPDVYHFGLFARVDSCGTLIQKLIVEVHLVQRPFINKTLDTLQSCFAQPLNISASFWNDSMFWRPGAGLGDINLANLSFKPYESAYVYISHPRLGDLDSVYINLDPLPNRIPLQMTADGMEMEFVEPHYSVYQQWWLNNVIPFDGELEDENLIIGAGTYNVWSYLDLDSCPNITDTLTIPHNERWGGNSWAKHPESISNQKVLGSANNQKYIQKLKITRSARQLQNLYVTGFKNTSSNPQIFPVPLKVELQFANGLYFTQTFNIRNNSYIDYPIYLALDTTMEVDVSVTVPQNLEFYLIEGTGARFEHNGLRFLDFRKINGTDTTATILRPAIGFKFESDISLSEEDFQPIALYPNPASDHLILTAPKGSSWQIHNLSGQMVAEGRQESDIADILIDNFSPGFYLLSVDGRNLKFVKE